MQEESRRDVEEDTQKRGGVSRARGERREMARDQRREVRTEICLIFSIYVHGGVTIFSSGQRAKRNSC